MQSAGSRLRTRLVLPVCVALTLLIGANLLFMQSPRPATESVAPAAMALAESAAPARSSDALTRKIAELAAVSTEEQQPEQLAQPPSDLVKNLQRALAARGYQPGGATGVADVMTRGAILAYEHDHGLPLTAEPSQALLEALTERIPAAVKGKQTSTKPGPVATRLIRQTQTLLRKLAYRVGSTDGELDAETIRAIRRFEDTSGLPQTGRVSGALLAELARMSGTKLDLASVGAPQ